MNKLVLGAAALLIGVSDFGGTALYSSVANAETFTVRRHVNNDRCYRARRVPATIEVNSKGILLKGAARSWEGNMNRHGAKIRNKYHDPVYIQTERVIEDQHMTLVPVPC